MTVHCNITLLVYLHQTDNMHYYMLYFIDKLITEHAVSTKPY